jgi:formyltetrahydrofolate-dependent phosphoribosylglycinamide formyltransferase
MFQRLQKKWGVGPGRIALILVTFAVGGSLTGYAGKWIMSALGVTKAAFYIPLYIIVITLVWPIMVLLVSVFTGQFIFFRKYLYKMKNRIWGKRKYPTGNIEHAITKGDPFGLAIFASGAGSNAQKIIDHFRNSQTARVVLIVCNKANAGVTEIARREQIPLLMIEKERFFRGDAYVQELKNAETGLIVLAGFLWKIPQALIDSFPRRIINIHPALLPKYGGKGMYGHYVHESVINAGEVQSGITIHYVDEHYDNGDIIFQTACPVLDGDTAENLAHRIHELEHLHYPQVIERVVEEITS